MKEQYKKTKMLRDPENYSYDITKNRLTNLQNNDIKTLAIFLYATGSRISEAITIKKKDLQIMELENKEYLVIRAPILKKGKAVKSAYRQAVVNSEEKWIIEPIAKWVEPLDEQDILFPLHRVRAYQLLMQETGINPHGFRKLRATHLATKYKFTDQQLVKFFGWANSLPASIYTKLNLSDIAY